MSNLFYYKSFIYDYFRDFFNLNILFNCKIVIGKKIKDVGEKL